MCLQAFPDNIFHLFSLQYTAKNYSVAQHFYGCVFRNSQQFLKAEERSQSWLNIENVNTELRHDVFTVLVSNQNDLKKQQPCFKT